MPQHALTDSERIVAAQNRDGRIHCPECAHLRSKSHEKTCSITIDTDRTLYDCHHCGWAGVVFHDGSLRAPVERKITKIPTQLNEDRTQIAAFFRARGVALEDFTHLPPVVSGMKWFPQAGREVPAIGFVYGDREHPTAIKWRAVERKAFTQDGTAAEFYGLEQLDPGADDVIIVEGETCTVALSSIGLKTISVPNGAPMKVSKGAIDPSEDKKFGYIWEAKNLLGNAKRILLAVDQDEPGNALAEEIARRVGRAKCWRVKFPEGCKDPEDVLRDYGAQQVKDCLETAQPMPLSGVYAAKEYEGKLFEVYRNGLVRGLSTGFKSVDDLFTVSPGRLTVVTGYPGSGKSEWCDQIMVNLAKNHNWKSAICSFENPPHIHIAKLAEKIIGRPFHDGVTPRMTQPELSAAMSFINEHFTFLESRDGSLPTIGNIMDRTKQAVMRLGVRNLIIDPYNFISRDKGVPEYEWISDMLTEIGHFARAYDLHIFFIAHPTKIQPRDDGTYPVPKGMQISGSAAWFSKADFGLTVHRGEQGVEVHCWKARFKWEGGIGATLLDYDIPTGRYSEHVDRRIDEWSVPAPARQAPAQVHWQESDWKDF